MDVFNIGRRILGTPFALCSKPQELSFEQRVTPRARRPRLLSGRADGKVAKTPDRFSIEKASFPNSIYINRFLVAFQVLPEQLSQ